MQIPLLERHHGTFSLLVLLCLYLHSRATLVHGGFVASVLCFVLLCRSQVVAEMSLKRFE